MRSGVDIMTTRKLRFLCCVASLFTLILAWYFYHDGDFLGRTAIERRSNVGILGTTAIERRSNVGKGQKRYLDFSEFDTVGVMTTINHEVNEAVKNFVSRQNVGLVIVGDQLTDPRNWKLLESMYFGNTVYLSPAQQRGLPFELIKKLPWNHFGRKNVGYLYAIYNGAKTIFDFDDDNHLTESFKFDDPLSSLTGYTIRTSHHLWNPYSFFEPTLDDRKHAPDFIWPRGFPLQFIKDENTTNAAVLPKMVGENLAIVQSIANHNPDVDAIYRMTAPLPMNFQRNDAIVVLPRGTFTPWNAQAVLAYQLGYFGLLLPVTVTGRVSDIWRSYITTRLLWETDMKVAFTSALVTQYRNPHSYQKDLESEVDLYVKADGILRALSSWTSHPLKTLDEAYLDLVSEAVVHGYLEKLDLELARAWVKDLNAFGYVWPNITNRLPSFETRARPVVDERDDFMKLLPTTQLDDSKVASAGRRVAWIGQGPARYASKWMKRFNDTTPSAALFYHSYDAPCEGCIYLKGTTYATGRNMLLRKAIKTVKDVYYFVIFDGDMQMTCDDSSDEDECWRSFHNMLSHPSTLNPFIAPKTWREPPGEATNYATCLDNAISAFRHDFVHMVYPLPIFNMERGWNFNNHVQWHITERCFPDAFLSDSRWRVQNPDHTGYPQRYDNYSYVVDILEHDYAKLGPWDTNHEMWHRCSTRNVTPSPTSLWPTCQAVFQQRFDEWMARSGQWAGQL